MGIDFSGIGQKPSVDQALSLPPEASLIPPTAAVAEPASPGQLEQARSQLVEGKRLMREQRCDLALIHFNSAIEATELERLNTTASGAPISGVNVIAAQAQAHRGNALLQMEQLAEAMESYNIALGFDTTNLEAWLGKGRLLTKLERYEEALFCFDSALELDKTAIAAWSGKAEVLMQLGRQAEAQTCVDRVVSLGGEFSRPLPLITGPITTGLVPDPPIDVTPPATAGLPSVSPAYDPDVPMELQQMVQVLPSGDSGSSPAITPTILPDLGTVALLPDQGDIPEALTAAVAQLPDQGDIPEALTAAVAQLPDQGDIPEALTAAVAQLPDQGDIPEALTAAVAQLPDQADIPEALTAAVAQLPDQADIPEALTAAVAQLPDQADVPEVLAAIGEASPPFPLSLEEQLLGQVSLSAVLPPTIQDSPSPEATEPGAPPLVQASDSPLEAAIENSSYDSSNQPSPTLSWVKLSIDQESPQSLLRPMAYRRWRSHHSSTPGRTNPGPATLRRYWSGDRYSPGGSCARTAV
jgi:tetratricopeptide (TPR) repeat protein